MRKATVETYIKKLLKSEIGKKIGEILQEQYKKWKQNLELKDFYHFIQLIWKKYEREIMKALKGEIQLIGQFRAFAFEEYVHDLILRKTNLKNLGLDIYWNEPVEVWRGIIIDQGKLVEETYTTQFDLTIGKQQENKTIIPLIVIETKVDVDAPRLKAVMANFSLLKALNPSVSCMLIYINWNAKKTLKYIAKAVINHIYQFNPEERDETQKFIQDIISYLAI
ncbi:MAG: hypothetical protein ACTSXW_07915 [Candidatus Baldrarchaeia archaeon]